MIKKLCLKGIVLTFIITSMCNNVLAANIDNSYEKDLSIFTPENHNIESGELTSIEALSVKSESELNGNSINLYSYSDDIQDYVSVRDIIELVRGTITWERIENTEFNSGNISIDDNKYKYVYSALSEYNIKTGYSVLSLYSINKKGKERYMDLNGNGPITLKLNNGKLLMPVYQLMDLLSRWGYVYTFDFEQKQFKIEKHNFVDENDYISKNFPKTSGLFYYNSEELKSYYSIGYDFYTNISATNSAIRNAVIKHFDKNFKPYVMATDYEKQAKLYYKGCYLLDTDDDNITVEYNNDIDCYIAYNNRCDKESSSFKMIIMRKFDGQVIYAYYQ